MYVPFCVYNIYIYICICAPATCACMCVCGCSRIRQAFVHHFQQSVSRGVHACPRLIIALPQLYRMRQSCFAARAKGHQSGCSCLTIRTAFCHWQLPIGLCISTMQTSHAMVAEKLRTNHDLCSTPRFVPEPKDSQRPHESEFCGLSDHVHGLLDVFDEKEAVPTAVGDLTSMR